MFVDQTLMGWYGMVSVEAMALGRPVLTSIRADFESPGRAREFAEAFGAEVILESPERPGSLRRAAREAGVDVLVYEGGEGLRFDEFAIKAGVDGIVNVMLATGLLELPDGVDRATLNPNARPPVFANASRWVRAPDGGVFRTGKRIGEAVSEGEAIGFVANPYEDSETEIRSPRRGIIVGRTTLPIVNMGDALFHIAWSEELDKSRPPGPRDAAAAAEPVMDEDEII